MFFFLMLFEWSIQLRFIDKYDEFKTIDNMQSCYLFLHEITLIELVCWHAKIQTIHKTSSQKVCMQHTNTTFDF